MKRYVKVLICTMLSFLFVFLSMGYAQLTDTLTLTGSASGEPPKELYISGATVNDSDSSVSFSSMVLSSTVVLDTVSSTVAIDLTVFNNSDYTYYYKEVTYDSNINGAYTNAAVKYTVSGISAGQTVLPGESTSMRLTFSYGGTSTTATNIALSSILNIKFSLTDESISDLAADNSVERFGEILNNVDETGTFDELINYMDSSSHTSYVGNVVGSAGGDSELVEGLFTVDGENKLVLEIDGVKKEVTVMIKREDVDGISTNGDNGSEMTIYMTPDPISSSNRTPVVYAAVFTRDTADGEWYQLGGTDAIFVGSATANNYNGYPAFLFGYDSFNTDTWKSTQAYYGVASGATIEQIIAAIPDA